MRKKHLKIVYLQIKAMLYYMVDNMQLMLAAATMHWTLPFCIALCSRDLFGSDALEHCLEHEFGDDAV